MTQHTMPLRHAVQLDLSSKPDQTRLAELLASVRPGTPVQVVIGDDAALRPTGAPASFASAMREVEATCYDVA